MTCKQASFNTNHFLLHLYLPLVFIFFIFIIQIHQSLVCEAIIFFYETYIYFNEFYFFPLVCTFYYYFLINYLYYCLHFMYMQISCRGQKTMLLFTFFHLIFIFCGLLIILYFISGY